MKKLQKKLEKYSNIIDEKKTADNAESFKSKEYSNSEKIQFIKLAVSAIDLTTLEGSDTKEKVLELCKTARNPFPEEKDFPNCAAVCVYPALIKYAKKGLKRSKVRLASVGTAFPSGQYPLKLKLADVRYSAEEGVDEIDMVISRGEFLSGNFDYVYEEIKKVKRICTKKKNIRLKVILETGELKTPDNIRKASIIAILAGADFIKTSTGKISVSATLPSVNIMCKAIKEYYKETGIRVGIKVAGGIRTTEDALSYISLVKEVLGEEWLTPKLFRIGASSLLNDLTLQYKAIR